MSEPYQPTQEDLEAVFQDLERKKAYQEAETSSGYGDLPPGSYQARIEAAQLEWNRNGNLILKWVFVVLAPHGYKNRKIWLRQNLQEPSQDRFVKGALQGAGVDWWADFESINTRREELLDRMVELKLTQGGPKQDGGFFTNTYVNRYLGMYTPDGTAPAASEPADAPKGTDEIPF